MCLELAKGGSEEKLPALSIRAMGTSVIWEDPRLILHTQALRAIEGTILLASEP